MVYSDKLNDFEKPEIAYTMNVFGVLLLTQHPFPPPLKLSCEARRYANITVLFQTTALPEL